MADTKGSDYRLRSDTTTSGYSTRAENTATLTYSFYDYTFAAFHEHYRHLCTQIAGHIHIQELPIILKKVQTFFYDYEFCIVDKKRKGQYRDRIEAIGQEMFADESIRELLIMPPDTTSRRQAYRYKYYYYFTQFISLLGSFAMDLTATYMPHMHRDHKSVRYYNSRLFYQHFTEHKNGIYTQLCEFSLKEFTKCYNLLVTFYHAFSLFVTIDDQIRVNRALSLVLSVYLSDACLTIAGLNSYSQEQGLVYRQYEQSLHTGLLFASSVMNSSFSEFDVLPKMHEKDYLDKTLI